VAGGSCWEGKRKRKEKGRSMHYGVCQCGNVMCPEAKEEEREEGRRKGRKSRVALYRNYKQMYTYICLTALSNVRIKRRMNGEMKPCS
jgi:hypothetical protein